MNRSANNEIITLYDVSLVCGAAPAIGCGSRAKPLLMDLEEQSTIKEAWLNRAGTIVAIVWSVREELIKLRTKQELLRDAQGKFQEAVLDIYEKHIGIERTAGVRAHGIQNPFNRADREETSSCCP
jgi:hypothetical protein